MLCAWSCIYANEPLNLETLKQKHNYEHVNHKCYFRGKCFSAWTRQPHTQPGRDLHCAAPFKNLSPGSTAHYKSEIVDWDIPSWLLAQRLGPVMNAAIICWCMKREVHHHLLNIKPWQSVCGLVTALLALGFGGFGLSWEMCSGSSRLLPFACQ